MLVMIKAILYEGAVALRASMTKNTDFCLHRDLRIKERFVRSYTTRGISLRHKNNQTSLCLLKAFAYFFEKPNIII